MCTSVQTHFKPPTPAQVRTHQTPGYSSSIHAYQPHHTAHYALSDIKHRYHCAHTHTHTHTHTHAHKLCGTSGVCKRLLDFSDRAERTVNYRNPDCPALQRTTTYRVTTSKHTSPGVSPYREEVRTECKQEIRFVWLGVCGMQRRNQDRVVLEP